MKCLHAPLFSCLLVSLTACAGQTPSPDEQTPVNKADTTLKPDAPAAQGSDGVPLSASGTTPILTTEGYGPVRFGMTVGELEQTLGFHAENESLSPDPACHYIRIESLPETRFMVENDIITRAEVGKGIPTVVGVTVGTKVPDPKSLAPTPKILPHKYEDDAHYLVFSGVDKQHSLVMEESHGVITKIRSGLEPAVSYVEGCL
ncbi:hypothetical protein ACKC9G_14080 [Pokkaliibacter sp. CJK22405]|uniref:hypothetical protein n=1 Tax=Pokkaliibacter sp. CJK22405 TaxID=3384615 RepID=UPI0039854D55